MIRMIILITMISKCKNEIKNESEKSYKSKKIKIIINKKYQ
jgi:hypothetical protein